MFQKDKVGSMDYIIPTPLTNANLLTTTIIGERYTRLKGNVQLIGKLNCDLFNQSKYLPPKTRLNLTLIRSPSAFVIMAEESTKYYISIDAAQFIVPKIETPMSYIEDAVKRMRVDNVQFPVTRQCVIVRNIGSGESSVVLDNLTNGVLPNRVVVGLVDSDAASGKATKNPYYFKTHNNNSIQLFVNDHAVAPARKTGEESYSALPKAHITHAEFLDGYALYTWNCVSGENVAMQRANLRLEMSFTSPLANAVKVVIFFTYPDTILSPPVLA
jgi:hypothetical protein